MGEKGKKGRSSRPRKPLYPNMVVPRRRFSDLSDEAQALITTVANLLIEKCPDVKELFGEEGAVSPIVELIDKGFLRLLYNEESKSYSFLIFDKDKLKYVSMVHYIQKDSEH